MNVSAAGTPQAKTHPATHAARRKPVAPKHQPPAPAPAKIDADGDHDGGVKGTKVDVKA
jgi:hypothetical protein